MRPQDYYIAMNQSEEFRALSYEEQMAQRFQWFEQNAHKVPELMQLDDRTRMATIRNTVTAPPVLSNSAEMADGTRYVMDVANRVRTNGDPESLLAASKVLEHQNFTAAGGLITRLATRLDNRLNQAIPGRAERAEALGQGDSQVAVDMLEAQRDEDYQKAMDYLNAQMADAAVPGSLRARQIAASVAGLGVNLAAGRVAAGGIIAGVNALRGAATGYRGIAAATRAATAARSATGGRFAKWALSSMLPELAESTVDGIMLTSAEVLSGTVGDNTPRWLPQAQSNVANVALNFGYNVAADMVAFGVLNVMGTHIVNAARISRARRGMAGAADELANIRRAGGVTDEEFHDLIGRMIGGEDLPKEVFNSLPKQSQRQLRRMNRLWKQTSRLNELTDAERLEFLMGVKGYDLERTAEGFTLLKDGRRVGQNYADMDSAFAAAYRDANLPKQSTMSKLDNATLRDDLTIEKVTSLNLTDETYDAVSQTPGSAIVRGDDLALSAVKADIAQDVAARLGMNLAKNADGSVVIDGISYLGMDNALAALAEARVHKLAIEGTEEGLQELTQVYSKQLGIDIMQIGEEAGQPRWIAKTGKDVIASGEDLSLMLDELTERGMRPKLGMGEAPDIILDPEMKRIELREGTVHGPAGMLEGVTEDFFDQSDTVELVRRFGSDRLIERDPVTTAFRVTDGEWRVVAEFPTYKEAQQFLSKTVNDVEELRDTAFRKGFIEIEDTGGRLLLRRFDGENIAVGTLDEARNVVKSAPTPKAWRKEISNFEPKYIDTAIESFPPELRKQFKMMPISSRKATLNDMVEHLKGKSSWYNEATLETLSGKAERRYGVRLSLQKIFGNMGQQIYSARYNTMNRLAGETGATYLKRAYETMEKQIKNNRGLMQRLRVVIEASQSVPGVDANRRKLLRGFLEANPSRWDELAERLPGGLKASDRSYLARTRTMLENMGQMFGIDGWKMWNEYLPHIRRMMSDMGDSAKIGTAKDIMRKIFPQKMPKEVDFFAEHLRSHDLVRWLETADPAEMLMSYASAGVKKLTLGEAFSDVMREMMRGPKWKDASDQVIWTMTHYLQDVMSMYADESSQIAMRSSQEIADMFAKYIRKNGDDAPPQVMRDLVSTMHSFTIAATMSFRPWLPVRNMMQIWTTLAGHMGNGRIMRALRKMGDAKEVGERAMHLRQTGRLMTQNPMFELSSGLFTDMQSSRIQRLANLGMMPYKNSDEYTRLVVDFAVEDAFQSAAARLESGKISMKKFLRESLLDRFDVADQQQVVQLLKTQGYRSALDYYGDFLTRETMFPYTAGSNPAMYRGFFGRLFGMFGHYPVYFANNIKNGLSRGTLAQKIQFAGRVAFNSAALWFTFDQVLGIRADNFLPHKTMFFDGGPYYKLMNRAFSAARGGPGSPSVEQVINEAGRVLIPGSLAYRGFVDGVEALGNDDPYTALLRMLSVPVAD
jgi:hypothetical protein